MSQETTAWSCLPQDFLQDPRSSIVANKIDFANSTLPEYAGLYACVLDDVLSSEECHFLLKAAEATTAGVWERAQVNIGHGQQRTYEDIRKCGRIIYDSQPLVDLIWKRVERVPEVQEILRLQDRPLVTGSGPVKRKEVWRLTRPNERLRFLKYVGGEYFREHCDGTYETPDRTERSYFTFHLYLSASVDGRNQEDDQNVNGEPAAIGGATIFHPMSLDEKKAIKVEPVPGRVLVFQHRNLLHSGDDVVQGVKYTMRTDLMYALEKPGEDL